MDHRHFTPPFRLCRFLILTYSLSLLLVFPPRALAQAETNDPDAAEMVESAVEDDITGMPGLGLDGETVTDLTDADSPSDDGASATEVQAAEDEIVATPPGETAPEGEAPPSTEGELSGEGEFTDDELDLIALPDDMTQDASALELPMDELFPSADLPPLDIAPALPNIPVGEPARQLSARYKAVRIKVDKDPSVIALKESADAASTFEDQRAALREYYRLLFQKMREEDKTLTTRVDAMERAYLERLSQTRIEPTIPLNPPPTPEPLSTNSTPPSN